MAVMNDNGKSRETFGSRFAVIMAMAGSAIGLGNIWRFPYMLGENGGAAFIIVYLVCTVLLSVPVFLSEAVIGRKTHLGTFGAMRGLAPHSGWKWLGLLTVVTPFIILSYYSVVGGWSIEYLAKSFLPGFTDASPGASSAFFERFTTSVWGPLACHTLFLLCCAVILLGGVKKGIERFSNVTMPLLFVLIVAIAIYSIALPGASEGVKYLLKPDFSKINGASVAAAMGQSFFSLSLGVGAILTYSSYIEEDENLMASAAGTVTADLLFAILAGFAIMPAVFAAGIEPGAGPGLLFDTLPYIFAKMGLSTPVLSHVVSVLFFLAILVAALSSAVSLFEVEVSFLIEERGLRRGTAIALVFTSCWAVGALCSLSFGPLAGLRIAGKSIFGFLDMISSDYLMALGGLLFAVFVGWKLPRQTVYGQLAEASGTPSSRGRRVTAKLFPPVYFLIKWAAPVLIVIVFITNLLYK